MEAPGEREGSLVEAVSRVMDAGQRVLVDRVEIALAEALGVLRGMLGELTLAGFAVLFLLLPAWLTGVALAAVWLASHWSLEASLAALAITQLVLGIGLLAWVARRRSSQPTRLEDAP